MCVAGRNIIRRSTLSIGEKLKVLQQLKSGMSINKLAAEHKVHPVTIRRIRRNAELVNQFLEQGNKAKERKRLRKPANEELDGHLYAWFLKRKARDEPITDSLLLEKAKELDRNCGSKPSKFKASRGWLWKFKNRHGIYHHKRKREDKVAGTGENPVTAVARSPGKPFVQEVIIKDEVMLSDCEEEEKQYQERQLDKYDSTSNDDDSMSSNIPSDDEIERAIDTLMKWSKCEPDMVKLQVECLKSYFEEQYVYNKS